MKRICLSSISFLAGTCIILIGGAPVYSVEQNSIMQEFADSKNLEPYLGDSFRGLLKDINSEDTPFIINRMSIQRLISRYPTKAPDVLVPLLYGPLHEYVGQLLFKLGKPHSKTDALIARVRKGGLTHEQIVAFTQAVSWPGNKAAIPFLQKMIDENLGMVNEATLCLARILEKEDPESLLKTVYNSRGEKWKRMDYSLRVAELLRAKSDKRLNHMLLKDDNPARALALWGGRGIYALAWKSNKALAHAYIKTSEPDEYFHIAAARTQDKQCLKVIRDRFEKETEKFLASSANTQDMIQFKWILIAGVEAANGETVPILKKLIKMIEDMRVASEVERETKMVLDDGLVMTWDYVRDPLRQLRDIILDGLCVHPNPDVRSVLEPYLNDSCNFKVGLALLRAGYPDGLHYIINNWAHNFDNNAPEVFLAYTSIDVLRNAKRQHDKQSCKVAMEWFAQHKEDKSLCERIALVNKKELLANIIEELTHWP